MAEITTRGLTKLFDRDVLAVDGIDLDVADGELLVLVGPSGCGKSTLLRMVAGLEEVTAGSVTIGSREVTYLPPKKRDIAMVFQSYALYPHMTVRKNIGYPLRLAKVPSDELDRRVTEVAGLLHLEEVLDRRPSQLSGGQRQRVAMGRALVREPQAFLMDEPLSNLDAKLRVEMRAEIARLQRDLGVTTLYVTHDQVEAMTMGTRVAVLNAGRLLQVDTPQRIYDAPVNLFVATFIGSPAMNLFAGTVEAVDGTVSVRLGTQRLLLDARVLASHPGIAGREEARVVVGIRPEAFDDAALDPGVPGDRVVEATVDLVESLGAELVVHVGLNRSAVPDRAETAGNGTPRDAGSELAEAAAGPADGDGDGDTAGDRNGAAPTPWHDVVARRGRAVARLSTKSRVRPGDIVKLSVDPAGIHVFDAETGDSLRRPLVTHDG